MRTSWMAAAGAAVATALAMAATSPAGEDRADRGDRDGGRAKNVIFLHGDGMGASQRELIRLTTVGRNGDLAMNRLRYAGVVETDPDDPSEAVTDSAAGATAYASGVRTFNGAVGVDARGRSVPTLLERARAAGKATGLVTTAQVTDATPAAFGAHVRNRAEQSEIARQFLVRSRPAVILGGGEDYWYPAGQPGAHPDRPATDPSEQSKGTRGNLVERARRLGYQHVTTRAALARSRARKLLGLFANEEMFEQRPEGEGDRYEPSVPLDVMTSKALDVLRRDRDGFFLMVEEEGIDEMAHRGNARLAIEAGRALDRAVRVAVRFAARHPGTLIVVAGDHETGGLAIENVDAGDEGGDGATAEDGPFRVAGTDLTFSVDWTTPGHTGESTPLTAQGPGARALARVQPNTHVHDAILAAMRLRDD